MVPGAMLLQLSASEVSLTLQHADRVNLRLPRDAILQGRACRQHPTNAENIGNYIPCGDLQGSVDANGSLVVGLVEVNNSGFAAFAVLTPSAVDPSTTDVSVFIASGLTEASEM